MSLDQALGLRQTLEQALQDQKAAAQLLKVEKASRYFLFRYIILTAVLYASGSLVAFYFPQATTAFYYGMSLCTVTSFISFLLTEWAFDQPKAIFMGVALGSIVVRMFNLLIAFFIGGAFLKFNHAGLASGLLIAYFSYLIVEIAYVHNKALLRGE